MTSYGFTYNGIHSDTMGITLNKTIHGVLPPLAASKQKVPKRAGSWYTRTDKGDRWIQCQITVTGTSHTDLRSKIRQIAGWLNPTDTPQALVFDNEPNITYYAVVDEGGMGGNGSQGTDISQIVTLGQGTIIFMCPVPFAYGSQHSQGIDAPTGTFGRNSVANNPNTLASVALGDPRFVPGKFGNGVFIEEGTTNLVLNSDFETVTISATVFADALTSYMGSTVPAPWTLQTGSWTFGAGGATSGANGSLMSAGNAKWKPVLGSDGTSNLAFVVEATFTEPSVVPSGQGGYIDLFINISNRYQADLSSGNFRIVKEVAGVITTLATISQTLLASTSYTITLSLDYLGNLTAKLYQGTNTSGTLLQTLTVTDTSLSGGFLIGLGGDTGVVVSNASVTAPWANGWTIGGDHRVAWALSSASPISGNYSMSVVGVASGIIGYSQQGLSLTNGTTYTFSSFLNTANVGSDGAYLELYTTLSNKVIGTTSTDRISQSTSTLQSGGPSQLSLVIRDVGTATFDAIQLEQKPYATSYVRNDSMSATATRSAETLTLPESAINASEGTVAFWVEPQNDSTVVASNADAFNDFCYGAPGSDGFLLRRNVGPTAATPIQAAIYTGTQTIFLNDATAYSAQAQLFIVFRWSASGCDLLVNGVKVASTASVFKATTFTLAYVGGRATELPGNATYDEFCIFNRSLSDAEVTSLYQETSAAPPVTDGLTALYPFDSDVANSPQPVDVQGTAETLPVVTVNFTSSSTNYQVTHVETGDLVNILHDFVAGDELVIDCTKNSVTINGANALTDLDIASDFFQLASGSNTFTVQSPGDAVTELSYTERWL